MVSKQTLLKEAIIAAIEAGKATLHYWNSDVKISYKSDDSPLTQADLRSNDIIRKYLDGYGYPMLSEESKIQSFAERKNWKELWIVDPLDGTKEFIAGRTEYTVNIGFVSNGTPILGVVYAPALDLLYFALDDIGSFFLEGQVGTMDINAILDKAIKLPLVNEKSKLRVVASKLHLSDETKVFIDTLKANAGGDIDMCNYGSSLKLCRVAEGSADVYPRLGPTMEWDTAAAHAVVIYAKSNIKVYPGYTDMQYNKENLLNPFFVIWQKSAEKFLPK